MKNSTHFTGKAIIKLVAENPRRSGTLGFKSFELVKNNMPYATYLEKGGRYKDLLWDLEHEYIKMEKDPNFVVPAPKAKAPKADKKAKKAVRAKVSKKATKKAKKAVAKKAVSVVKVAEQKAA